MGWRLSCEVGKAMEGLENELCSTFEYLNMGGTPGELSEELVT